VPRQCQATRCDLVLTVAPAVYVDTDLNLNQLLLDTGSEEKESDKLTSAIPLVPHAYSASNSMVISMRHCSLIGATERERFTPFVDRGESNPSSYDTFKPYHDSINAASVGLPIVIVIAGLATTVAGR